MEALSVLVIEDSPSFSRLLTRGLEREGYQVDVAPDIASAQLYLSENIYTIMLVDKGLPDGDGIEFVYVLRQKEVITPVIALAEPDFSEEQSPELDDSIQAFIPKPFAFDDLLSSMESLVRDFLAKQDKEKNKKQTVPKFTSSPTIPLTEPKSKPTLEVVNVSATSRGDLDLPSNLFRAISPEEGLAKLSLNAKEQKAAVATAPVQAEAPKRKTSVLPLPAHQEIIDVFGMLLDRPLTFTVGRPIAPSKANPLLVASFASVDDKEVYALCFIDISLANSAAGALALLPGEEVKNNITLGEVPEELYVYLKEVFRVLGTLFNKPDVPQVKLHHLYRATGLLPHEDAVIIEEQIHRTDLTLSIDGYPDGKLSLLLV